MTEPADSGSGPPATPAQPDPVTGRSEASASEIVLREIGSLLDELRLRPTGPLRMDSDLTTELGVDSLALVELHDRLEGVFGVTLTEDVFSTATTPRDWLAAVRGTRGEESPREASAPHVVVLRRPAGQPWPPNDVHTLTGALTWHVNAHPDLVCLRLLGTDAPGLVEEISYGTLQRESSHVANALVADGVARGDRVAIMLPTGRQYFTVFLGVLLAGAVPVPIYPPAQMAVLEAHLIRQSRLLDNAGASVLVTLSEAMVTARLVRSHVASLRAVRAAQSLIDAGRENLPLPIVTDDDVALIQYTSGSTGDPKGVVLTHAQLIANIASMGGAIGIDTSDVLVSWLPLYHDMGLIGCWHTPLYFGIPLVIQSPLTFLARPVSWLQAISTYSGTLSAAPNFAYQSCVDRIADADLVGLDLSTWRVAINGSEPVNQSSVDRFVERFAPWGFHRETMCPGYGLAEMGVGVAFAEVGRGTRADTIERAALQQTGRALAASRGDPTAITLVGCGRALSGYEVRIVGPGREVLPERAEGTVECRGPSATSGYFKNEDANRALWHDGWLDTGDLGYIADGDLFLTGRTKDLIIRGGRKLHPEDLEQSLCALDGVSPGAVAVFASPDARRGTEQIVVVVETDVKDPERRTTLEREITRRALDLLGAAPDQVVLTTPGALLRTASGKIRRGATRDALAAGVLGRTPAPAAWQLARFAWSAVGPSVHRIPGACGAGLYGLYAWTLVLPVAVGVWILSLAPVSLRTRCSIARALGRALCGAMRIRLEFEGAPPDVARPLVVAANHPSFIDALALFLAFREPVVFVTSTDLERHRLLGPVLRRFGCVFIDRGKPERSAASVARLVSSVRRGRHLVIFPEGSLSRAFGLRPFHQGAFVTATEVGCAVVPVGIRGTRHVLRPGTFWPHPGSIRVVFGAPIAPAGDDIAARVRLRDAVRRSVAELSGEIELEAR
jgi:1-acyl-sn-glycerol-3-phosphate acyltransferase